MFLGLLVLTSLLDASLYVDGSISVEKRSPSMGFMGLRGKRDDLEEEQLAKRAAGTLGFSGMRGKKDASDEMMDLDDLPLYDKRGPSSSLGFNGMRGKKADPEDAFDEKRAHNTLGFSGLRGKKLSAAATEEDDDAGGGLLAAADYDKRAQRNVLGFSGMRGKKSDQDDDLFGLEQMKRGGGGGVNALGFSGMRGKKDASADYGKRARAMSGFVGMRGRRDFWEDDGSNGEKRAPSGQAFMGMRGKRPEQDPAEEEVALAYLLSPEAAREGVVTYRSKRFLPINWPLRNSKKAPFSGFIGMRGKKNFLQSGAGLRSGNFMSVDFDQ